MPLHICLYFMNRKCPCIQCLLLQRHHRRGVKNVAERFGLFDRAQCISEPHQLNNAKKIEPGLPDYQVRKQPDFWLVLAMQIETKNFKHFSTDETTPQQPCKDSGPKFPNEMENTHCQLLQTYDRSCFLWLQ